MTHAENGCQLILSSGRPFRFDWNGLGTRAIGFDKLKKEMRGLWSMQIL
jgi:hypothetical protein